MGGESTGPSPPIADSSVSCSPRTRSRTQKNSASTRTIASVSTAMIAPRMPPSALPSSTAMKIMTGWTLDGIALDARRDQVALDLVDDDVEHDRDDGELPGNRQGDDHRRDASKERADIGQDRGDSHPDAEHKEVRNAKQP